MAGLPGPEAPMQASDPLSTVLPTSCPFRSASGPHAAPPRRAREPAVASLGGPHVHATHSPAHAHRAHTARTPRTLHAHSARTPCTHHAHRTHTAQIPRTRTPRTPHAHCAHTTHTLRAHTHRAHSALFCYYESASEQVRGAPAARVFPSSPTSSSSLSVYWITNIPERRHKSFYQMKKLGIKEVTWLSIQSKITL
ncbi:unnamed protein product [Nyctereutes procyonoides]|uniref:(raccoon dog) hypothetical protein n=1 Tax=Nyctereutes procyonoides TaxID=34880 RepID=A0A811ZB73_NYCPR|nr:unnamed protein product [Nyctereutes procyonoides]